MHRTETEHREIETDRIKTHTEGTNKGGQRPGATTYIQRETERDGVGTTEPEGEREKPGERLAGRVGT